MNLSRCEKGHFYDKEKYATCPHCSGGSATDDSLTAVFTEEATAAITPAAAPVPAPTPDTAMPVTPIAPVTPVTPIMPAAPAPSMENQISNLPVADMSADQMTVAMTNADNPTVALNSNPFDTNMVPEDSADDDDDHTVAFFEDVFAAAAPSATAATAEAPKTVKSVNKVSTPCVGWLIALGGGHIGTDFRLKAGKNFIGRNANMDVALTEDKSVSRDRHAIVVYEPKQHLYLVQPGESSSLVYKNNEVVLSPVELKAYDMITVGDVNLLFMPLCGEKFNWSDLFEQMK